MNISTSTGDIVKVTNVPTRTVYYRGKYFRTTLTVSTTPSGFRMTSRATFVGHQTGNRWFWVTDTKEWFTYTYDNSRCECAAPF